MCLFPHLKFPSILSILFPSVIHCHWSSSHTILTFSFVRGCFTFTYLDFNQHHLNKKKTVCFMVDFPLYAAVAVIVFHYNCVGVVSRVTLLRNGVSHTCCNPGEWLISLYVSKDPFSTSCVWTNNPTCWRSIPLALLRPHCSYGMGQVRLTRL